MVLLGGMVIYYENKKEALGNESRLYQINLDMAFMNIKTHYSTAYLELIPYSEYSMMSL